MKSKHALLFGLVLGFGLPGLKAHGQITVTTGYNAQQLAQTLVGQGVIMFNAQLNGQCPVEGASSGAGKFSFNGNPSDIGIDSGIVLTSGDAAAIDNPVTVFASGAFTGGIAGDADLDSVLSENGSNSTTEDACVLEFDFVPAGDTIKFDYVFGSEEYPEYACSTFNDVFAFFINGPGLPNGINNIALIPNTTIPVAINSINNITNPSSACTDMGTGSPFSQYYIDNEALGGQNIVYDGYTTVLTAISSVIPCDTYHLKLAIADAGDQSFDSGVFLRAGSLNSVGITLDARSTQGGNDPLDPHCIRGCKPGKFVFKRPSATNKPLTIHYLIGGTAQRAQDYEDIPDSIIIPAYQDSAVLNIYGKVLPAPVGPKTVILNVLSPYNCADGEPNIIDSSTITIFDSLYVKIPVTPVTTCPNTEVTIHAEIDTTLDYSWSPEALIPDPRPLGLTIHPKPSVTTVYTLSVTMPGAPATCPPATAKYKVTVEPYPTIQMPATDTTICIQHDSVNLNILTSPTNIAYTYKWLPGTYLRNDYSSNNMFFAPEGTYHYDVAVTSPVAHCADTGGITIHVIPPFIFDWVSPEDTTIHYGDQIQLNSQSDAIYWLWSPITGLDNPNAKNPMASPKQSTQYTLVGFNKFGCTDTAKVNINVDYLPAYGIPNAFSPNGDGKNDYFKIENIRYEKILTFKIFNRWGQLVYDGKNAATGWDGRINGKPAPIDTYNYYIELVLPLGKHQVYKGTVTLLR
ncbi:MAG TPA: choice-of-anchor L domain-containing protein [Edaphocola sp.]|nr:choice-of-anchor L domain-containing protein [Edaphocola sp.]